MIPAGVYNCVYNSPDYGNDYVSYYIEDTGYAYTDVWVYTHSYGIFYQENLKFRSPNAHYVDDDAYVVGPSGDVYYSDGSWYVAYSYGPLRT